MQQALGAKHPTRSAGKLLRRDQSGEGVSDQLGRRPRRQTPAWFGSAPQFVTVAVVSAEPLGNFALEQPEIEPPLKAARC